MEFFNEIATHVDTLRSAIAEDLEPGSVAARISSLDDARVVEVLSATSSLIAVAERLRIVAAGVAASRSRREDGHAGLAQTRGHRTPVSLVQELTGSTRADAAKHVRLGASMLEAVDAMSPAVPTDDVTPPWHAPLAHALLEGEITSAQHDAILRGLGEPPTLPTDAEAVDVWSLAAEQLVLEARERTVEELGRAARSLRDQLDPDGAAQRFDERFEGRSFRLWRDADGLRRASIQFDDEMGAWVETIGASALRPRRGGPRFVDPEEKKRAEDLVADPRTNDQLLYDLMMDTLRAGALADAPTVFGTRQAGVRVVITDDALARTLRAISAVGLMEEDQSALPGSILAQRICDSGAVECTLDRDGNPLYLGREARLFSPKQRIALALRDGGCRWRGCDRPASYCEAHHIDQYARDHGRTDIDRGILLCRFHHMQLHHGGWQITRDRMDDFVLHPPPGRGDTVMLTRRLALRYAWGDIDPPARRFRPTG